VNPNDFDMRQEREEEREEDRFSAKLSLEEFSRIRFQRCCVFTHDAGGAADVIHGRVTGLLVEMDALVIRDLRLGREALQTKQLIPVANVHRLCASPSLEKCRGCYEYREMEKVAKWEARSRRKAEGSAKKAGSARRKAGGRLEKSHARKEG
jgi:hypothetical protein